VESLSKRLFKTPEYCAACHKQFIDEEINSVGWVQLQNQYDNWRKSRWNHPGEADRTLECRECHMPLMDSADPASGDSADYNRTAKTASTAAIDFWPPTSSCRPC
jgi:nitrate/TMAO reductase-like tetraheme cytochrome c subunit